MTRTTKVLMVSLAATLAITGCGAPASDVADAEVVALEAVSYAADEVDEAGVRPRAARKLLRRDTLHGEVVVQGRDGKARTVAVQRGEVTAVTDTGFTVRSSDGFALTWTNGEKMRVVEQQEKSTVRTGTQVGVAGVRDGSVTTARVVVVG
jgi:hypothetical protein